MTPKKKSPKQHELALRRDLVKFVNSTCRLVKGEGWIRAAVMLSALDQYAKAIRATERDAR